MNLTINETESAVPTNSVGNSSSTTGTGGLDIYDKYLRVSRKENRRKNTRQRHVLRDLVKRDYNV